MSEEIVYIDYDETLTIYGKMIDASDGGFEGVMKVAFVLHWILYKMIYTIRPLQRN